MRKAFALITHPIGFAVVCTVIAFGSFRLGAGRAPNQVTPPDTVYAERQLLLRDTVHVIVPDYVTLFDTVRVTDTRVDTIRVPVEFGYVGVVGAKPITRSGGNKLTLTTFDLGHQRWTQQTYTLPKRKWGFGLHAVTTVTNAYIGLSFEADLRYKRVTMVPLLGVHQSSHSGTLGLRYGLRGRYRIL